MKEATGELNMTVVTVVAIAAVGGFFYLFIWPGIKSGLIKNTCQNICPGGVVSSASANTDGSGGGTCTCGESGEVITIDADGNPTWTEGGAKKTK